MVFSSLIFVFYFLPIVLLLYYISPFKMRNLILLIVNLVFYAWGEPVYIIIMIFSVLADYIHGLLIRKFREKKNIALIFVGSSIITNILLLSFFKYANFLIDILQTLPGFSSISAPTIPLPIGISFYTFQTMSYAIDVYRREIEPEKNIIRFGTYVTLFPQLIAGPIVRYKDIEKQLKGRKENIVQFSYGIKLFLIGLSKKLLIANQMGLLWDALKISPQNNGFLGCWLGITAYAFQIYFDFSGYSDMARGLANMFGFEFLKNFNYPYISKSITEFWRRWHISLGAWFRDYVYIPLGGNRKSKIRTIVNLFAVWFLTGLWHGASWNFVLWGLYFFVLLLLEKTFLLNILNKLPAALSHCYAIICILLGWVIFTFDDLGEMSQYFKGMFSVNNLIISDNALKLIIEFIPLLLIAVFASLPVTKIVYERIKNVRYIFAAEITVMVVIMLLCTSQLVNQGYNPFLYFRF